VTQPSEAVRELARRLEPRVNALARSMAEAWAERLPEYRRADATESPSETTARGAAPEPMPVVDEALATARQAIRSFLHRLSGAPADERAREHFRERAAQRADEGMPLQAMVRAYMIGARLLYAELRDQATRPGAGPDEAAALPEIALLLFAALDDVVSEVIRAYQDESAALGSTGLERRRALVRDLVLGNTSPSPDVLEEFGLGDGVTVLALRFGRPDSGAVPIAPGADPTVTRRLHRVQTALDRHFDVFVPTFLDSAGGYAVVPGPVSTATRLPSVLADAWRDEVRIGIAEAAEPERIPAAARVAAEILRLAGALGRPPGAYVLEDVLLEYHLTRHDESSSALAALLDPLGDRPELLQTVRIFLEEQHDRRRTARRLALHPNTVDNRLARVAELTGLDPSTPRGVTLLVTALALRDLG
jgi:hypothetical protein